MVAAEAKGRKVYHLNIGQPDIETPKEFFDAVHSYSKKVLDYAPSPGVGEFLDAVCNYYKNVGISIEKKDVLATYGGSEALQIVLSCILDEGDEVLVPEPYYPNYDTFVKVTGGVIKPIHTTAEEGYRFAQRERIEPLITERTRAIMMTNPGNPTGVVLTAEERKTMAEIAHEHGLFLISDEVYRELVYHGEELHSMLEYREADENVIIIDSVSKRFSATGSRVGVVVSRNQELMTHALKLCQSRLCTATLDQIGAIALYNVLTPDYYVEMREEYRRRRDAVVEALSKIPGAKFHVPDGAFYLMVTLPVDDTEKLQYFLLEEFENNGETVMYAPGNGFYTTPGKGGNEIRVAYVNNCEDLTRSIELLKLGIEAYNAKKEQA
jgi:aspartate aminotransferase